MSHNPNALKDHRRLTVELRQNQQTVRFHAEVVQSQEARSHGLSQRKQPLAKNEAMLFYFTPPERVNFWMKNTFIPLEIAFFEPGGKLLQIQKMNVESNPEQPSRVYSSPSPVQVALEVAPNTLTPLLENIWQTELWVEKK